MILCLFANHCVATSFPARWETLETRLIVLLLLLTGGMWGGWLRRKSWSFKGKTLVIWATALKVSRPVGYFLWRLHCQTDLKSHNIRDPGILLKRKPNVGWAWILWIFIPNFPSTQKMTNSKPIMHDSCLFVYWFWRTVLTGFKFYIFLEVFVRGRNNFFLL